MVMTLLLRHWTSRILRGWLWLETTALKMAGNEEEWFLQYLYSMDSFCYWQGYSYNQYSSYSTPTHRTSSSSSSSEFDESLTLHNNHNTHNNQLSKKNSDDIGLEMEMELEMEHHEIMDRESMTTTAVPSTPTPRAAETHLLTTTATRSSRSTTRNTSHHERQRDSVRLLHATPTKCSTLRRHVGNLVAFVTTAALVAFYAVVHVHIIQEDSVFFKTWFYEWCLIPVLLSFVFCAPLHRALGFDHPLARHEECWRRFELLQHDTSTQRLVAAVTLCYLGYILGDAGFFIPQSPHRDSLATYPIYWVAVTTNIGFIYQGFLLTILAMRAVSVRLAELERDVASTLQQLQLQQLQSQQQSQQQSSSSSSSPASPVTSIQILKWATVYHELRQDMVSLSSRFALRMVVGLTMFVVEVTNMILNVWEAIGSTLTQWQALLLLLTYTANAAVLVMVVFQTAYTHTVCAERIGPQLAVLSLRTPPANDNKAELNVLAQTLMQAPIHLRAGNFHVTAEYANALTAWFFGLFALVFGMKIPNL